MSLYLPHDLNAFEDDKLVEMFGDLDYYGYGLYWRVLEMLYNSDDHTKVTNYKALSKVLNCDQEILQRLICDYSLFAISEDGSKFWSDRVLQQCDKLDKGKKDAAENGRKGAQKRWGNNRGAIGGLSKNDREPIGSNSNLNNNLNLNLNAAAAALTREEAAAAEAELFLDTETFSDIVTELANETAVKFGQTMAMPHQRRKMQELLNAIHIRGQDTPGLVREALQKLDKAEAITSGRMKFGIDQFLNPDLFLKLLHGNYDDCRKRDKKTTPGIGESIEARSEDFYS